MTEPSTRDRTTAFFYRPAHPLEALPTRGQVGVDRRAGFRDDRRATLYVRAYMLGMWLARDKRAFEGAHQTLRLARQRQRFGDAPPTRLTRLTTGVAVGHVAGMRVWTVRPQRRRPAARVLYVHGGGYVHPLSADYWRLVRALCRADVEVVVPAYPLAPDATLDDVLPKLLDVQAEAVGPAPGRLWCSIPGPGPSAASADVRGPFG